MQDYSIEIKRVEGFTITYSALTMRNNPLNKFRFTFGTIRLGESRHEVYWCQASFWIILKTAENFIDNYHAESRRSPRHRENEEQSLALIFLCVLRELRVLRVKEFGIISLTETQRSQRARRKLGIRFRKIRN